MEIVRPAFEVYEGNKEDPPPGYQQIKCHMVFDIKLGENLKMDYASHIQSRKPLR